MARAFKTGITTEGNVDVTGAVTASGNLRSTNSSGDEGGEIFLNKSVTNTTLTGGVTIDVWQNRLRFFEQGGSARGFYIDISTGGNSVGTNLVGGGGGTFTGGTLTSALTLKSGASGVGAAPLYFGTTTPSLLSTAAAGAFEFDNVSPYFTNSTSVGRGVIPSMNFFSLGSNRNITDGTSNSSIFGKSLTVEANRTYYFKVVVGGTKGTTNSFVRFLMTGTATLSAIGYFGMGVNGAAPDTVGGRFNTGATQANITTASTGTSWGYVIEGKFSVAAGSGGTWIPTCNFSATTGTTPTVTAGSYVYIYPISSTTTGDITIGAWA
jgi:hypothetical protein